MKFVLLTIIIGILYILFNRKILNTVIKCSTVHLQAREKFRIEIDGLYKLINPSITYNNGLYLISARYTNATMKNLAMYLYQKFDYNSYIGFAVMNNSFGIKKLTFPNFGSQYPLEDPRIAIYKIGSTTSIYVSVTEIKSPKKIFPVLFELNSNMEVVRRIEYNKSSYKDKHSIQKNWCPFQHEEKLLVHTNAYPTWDVYDVDTKTGVMNMLTSYPRLFESITCKNTYIRCSTSWKKFTDLTYLCGLHIKTYDNILHKFAIIRSMLVEVDSKTLCPIRRTDTFCIDNDHHPIQFLSGLEIDEDNVLMTFGLGDYQSVLYSISKIRINKILKSI